MQDTVQQQQLRNVVTLSGQGRRERVFDVTHTYLVEAEQTAGTLIFIDLEVPPGAGVPPHSHRSEDEAFYVLEGEIEISGDDFDAPQLLSKGAFFFGPRGRFHGLRNLTGEQSRLLVVATPGGSIQKMFAALAALTASSGGMPNRVDFVVICAEHDIVFAPPQ